MKAISAAVSIIKSTNFQIIKLFLMYKQQQEKSYLEATNVLYFILKWKKPLVIVTAVAALCSIIFSGERFIPPRFKSTVILFPASTSSISKSVMEEHPGDKQDILAFGEEQQAEQLLQILNSNEIRDRIVAKYHLMSHYRIDPSESYPYTKLYNEFNGNITFQRTEFMSVRIDVLDEDPQTAADIANDIAALSDSVKNKIQHSRAVEAQTVMENEYNGMSDQISKKEDSLHILQRLGIYDYRTQSAVLNEEYGKAQAAYTNGTAALTVLEKYRDANDTGLINIRARVKGAEAQLKDLDNKIAMLSKYGSTYMALNEDLTLDREQLSKIKEQYEKIKADAQQNVTHKFVVNYAEKAEKKSYPVRWLIVLVSTLSAFIFALLVLLGIEKFNDLRSIS